MADAKPPRKRVLGIPLGRSSSAYGYAQATDEAWSDYKKSTGRRFVKRSDFGDAIDFIGWYNHRSNKRLGLRKNDTYNLYLAYYNGHTGYAKGAWKKSATIKAMRKKPLGKPLFMQSSSDVVLYNSRRIFLVRIIE